MWTTSPCTSANTVANALVILTLKRKGSKTNGVSARKSAMAAVTVCEIAVCTEMLETKYHQPDTCVPGQHYLEHHRQAMLLSLPTKTEVSYSSGVLQCLESAAVSGFISLSGKK